MRAPCAKKRKIAVPCTDRGLHYEKKVEKKPVEMEVESEEEEEEESVEEEAAPAAKGKCAFFDFTFE